MASKKAKTQVECSYWERQRLVAVEDEIDHGEFSGSAELDKARAVQDADDPMCGKCPACVAWAADQDGPGVCVGCDSQLPADFAGTVCNACALGARKIQDLTTRERAVLMEALEEFAKNRRDDVDEDEDIAAEVRDAEALYVRLEHRVEGPCPVCGEHTKVVGETTDGRIVGACGDAFLRSKWED